MSEFLLGLFVRPMTVPNYGRLGMLVPLVLAISIVCKTLRVRRLASLPWASLSLSVMILFFMGLIAVALLGVFRLLA